MMARKYASTAWEEMKQAAVTQLPAESILPLARELDISVKGRAPPRAWKMYW